MDENAYNQLFEAFNKIVNEDVPHIEKLNKLEAMMYYHKPSYEFEPSMRKTIIAELHGNDQTNFKELMSWLLIKRLWCELKQYGDKH